MTPNLPENGGEHWFEPIAEHLGSAYLRYSFTKGTVQEVDHVVGALDLQPGERVLDVGCGPGRHAHELARRDARPRHRHLCAVHPAGPGRCPAGGDVRAARRPVDGVRRRVRRGNLPVPGRLRAADRRRPRRDGARWDHAGAASGGRLALSAFNAYFAVKYHTDAEFDADLGVAHEQTEVRDPEGRSKTFDGWTGCYTPRELRLLLAKHGLQLERISSVEPGAYGSPRRPPRPPSSSSSPAASDLGADVPGIREETAPEGSVGRIAPSWSLARRPDVGSHSIAIAAGRCYPRTPRRGRSTTPTS